MEYLVTIKRASDVNAYDLLQREKIMIEQDAVAVIEERLLGAAHAIEPKAAPAVSGEKQKAKKAPAARRVKAVKVGTPVKVRKMARAKKKRAQDKKRSKKK